MSFQFKYLKLKDDDPLTVIHDEVNSSTTSILKIWGEAINYCLHEYRNIRLVYDHGNSVQIIYDLSPHEIFSCVRAISKRTARDKFGILRESYAKYAGSYRLIPPDNSNKRSKDDNISSIDS